MNKQEIQNQIQALEKLKKLASKLYVSPEERFLQLVDIHNISIKIDKEKNPGSIFFFNGENFLAEYYESSPGKIWISWSIWDVFASEYGMESHEIQKFMRNQIREHFRWEVNKPLRY